MKTSRSQLAPLGSQWLSSRGGFVETVLRFDGDGVVLSQTFQRPGEVHVAMKDLLANYVMVRDARGNSAKPLTRHLRPHEQRNRTRGTP